MHVYFISGLAADREIFRNLRLTEGIQVHYLDWLEPVPGEALADYALRLGAGIDRSVPFVLIGLSLGGMIASELSRHYPPRLLVLLSSIASFHQLPPYYRLAGILRLHKIIPISLLKSAAMLRRFVTSESGAEKSYLRRQIRKSDPGFIRWALGAVLGWRGKGPEVPYIHIHGSSDHILPIRFVRPTHVIARGGHLMVLTRATEISRILNEHLIALIQPAGTEST